MQYPRSKAITNVAPERRAPQTVAPGAALDPLPPFEPPHRPSHWSHKEDRSPERAPEGSDAGGNCVAASLPGHEVASPSTMMASGMWDRLSTTAGALRNQVGRLAEEALASAEEFSQQVRRLRATAAAVFGALDRNWPGLQAAARAAAVRGPRSTPRFDAAQARDELQQPPPGRERPQWMGEPRDEAHHSPQAPAAAHQPSANDAVSSRLAALKARLAAEKSKSSSWQADHRRRGI